MVLSSLNPSRVAERVRAAKSALVALACASVASLIPLTSVAASAANANSPLGINLNGVTYYSSEQPFLNVFKTTSVTQANPHGWVTHSKTSWDTKEEAYLNLDANGYPISLTAVNEPSAQLFSSVGALVLRNMPQTANGRYPAGQYVVLYDGEGTMNYSFDAKLVTTSPGRDVITVATPSIGGIWISITATDPKHSGNYLRNIRVVKAENEAALAAGQIFNPMFVDLIRNFRALRFMDWLATNGNPLTSWASRPHPGDAGWGSNHGVPLEAAVQLCNFVGADCWLNVPHQATDDYITQMATLVHQQLNSNQHVYVEFSNEVWNGVFTQYHYAVNQGKALWSGSAGAGQSDFEYNRSWFGMRTAQVCDIWKSVWGTDFTRVDCVLGAQAANTYTATKSLACPMWTGAGNAPCAKHNITTVAIAPYFGFQAPVTWALLDLPTQLDKLFAEVNQGGTVPGTYAGGALQQVAGWSSAYATALAPYNLPFVAYEGGQTFEGFPTYLAGSWAVNLYSAANRDPRMGVAYTKYLQQWKTNGGRLFMLFNDIGPYSQYGEWAALESVMETTNPLSSAPIKWQAIQNFIAQNSCWWAGCSATAGAVPMAPSNLRVTK